MPLGVAPSVMAHWPFNWRLGQAALNKVLNQLSAQGYQVWPNGQLLVPSPFGLGSLSCQVEIWRPGVVFRFKDNFPWAILPGRLWRELRPRQIAGLLMANSHPLRFSPYRFWGGSEGLFFGRDAELALLLSPVPGLLVVGSEGMGKTVLLNRAARQCGTRVICCQAFSFQDLQLYLQELEQSGEMPRILFLDEMDALLHDGRTRWFLKNRAEKGLAWRAAVHQPWPGLGANLQLSLPERMRELLRPLAVISGRELSDELERTLLQAADGNPCRLQCLCHKILQGMGDMPHPVTSALIRDVITQAQPHPAVKTNETISGWAKVG